MSIFLSNLTVICHPSGHVKHENIFITLQLSTKFLNASFYCPDGFSASSVSLYEKILLSHVSRARGGGKSSAIGEGKIYFRFLRMSLKFLGDLDESEINFRLSLRYVIPSLEARALPCHGVKLSLRLSITVLAMPSCLAIGAKKLLR
jgi:hypothetical protein